MISFGDVYRGRRVLVTGHTGFKGSWLAMWLNALGARVSGLALPPATTPAHSALLGLPIEDRVQDVRDPSGVARVLGEVAPEIVFHLAAQPLVRRSYRDPVETWATNVMGTVNVLEACRLTTTVRAVVVVTTDKCYENREWYWAYRESDRLGGHDPYSASKAGAELVASSYRAAFFDTGGPLVATARAGNVIGGGDWSEDRLVCDLVRAVASGAELEIRSPRSTRPWQHVLESLSGYLLLGHGLVLGERELADAWNFGPDSDSNRTVLDVLERLRRHWPELSWRVTTEAQPHEAKLLGLDSAKARARLGWRPVWTLEEGLAATASWYRAFLADGRVSSREQLEAYVEAARAAGLSWAVAA